MNVASMNNLWDDLSGLSLTERNKQWLSQKLRKSTKQEDVFSKAEEVPCGWDGCWTCEDIDGSLEHAILCTRNQEARTVKTIDGRINNSL